MATKKLVIFDLDGTLLNTIADLADSTNYALTRCKFPTHPTEAYKMFVGNGINKLFERALPEGYKSAENILLIRRHFLEYYNAHSTDKTEPFDGVVDLLKELQQKGVKLAVASNKYHQATIHLVHQFFSEIHFGLVLGQRDGILPKPDAAIVYEIIDYLGIPKEQVLYVGDSGVDMQTANNAGVEACGVTWGFRTRQELEVFAPAHIVASPSEIIGLL